MATTPLDPASLTPDQLRIIDSARQRLDQLTKSIEAVRAAVFLGRPMPDLTALQAHSTILTQTSTSITSHISTHADLLSTLVAYPSTNFPGRTQELLANHLLRKKAEPGVDGWVGEGRVVGRGVGNGDMLEEDWRFAAGWTLREAQRVVEGSAERGEELEDEDEEGEEEDGDVEMDGTGGGNNRGDESEEQERERIKGLVRFMNTGLTS